MSLIDRPSPSNIFRDPRWLWEDAVYSAIKLPLPDGEVGWRARIHRQYLYIPFNLDPYIYAYPIPGSLSMDPVLDKEHHLIYLDGYDKSDHDLMVEWIAQEWFHPPQGESPRGNIIYYDIPGKFRAVHRVHRIYTDRGIRYWRFRGDNNFMWFFRMSDPYPALDEHIKWLVCSVIY